MLRVFNLEKLIDEFSEELAYLQNSADFWYYILDDQEMSSFVLDHVVELRTLANNLGILADVYDRALMIYDFSKSGQEDCIPDKNYIEEMHDMFESRHHSRLIF